MTEEITNPNLACDITKLPVEARESLEEMARALFGAALELRELSDGYALRISDSPGILPRLGQLIAYDRRCCPFLRHTILSEPDAGPIWMHWTGGPGVKEAVREELRRGLPEALAARLD